MSHGSTENTMSAGEDLAEGNGCSMDDRTEFRETTLEKVVLKPEKQKAFRVLYSAKGIESFVNKFLGMFSNEFKSNV